MPCPAFYYRPAAHLMRFPEIGMRLPVEAAAVARLAARAIMQETIVSTEAVRPIGRQPRRCQVRSL